MAICRDAAFSSFSHKLKELSSERPEFVFRGFIYRLANVQSAAVKEFERSFDLVTFGGGHTCPPQTQHVHADNEIPLRGEQKRRDVLAERRAALDHRKPSDPHVLMKRRRPAEERAVIYTDVSSEQGVVRDDYVITDAAIVPNVGTGHEEILAPERCRTSVCRAAMNRAMLANHIPASDLDTAPRLRIKSEILRKAADHRSVADRISCANPDPPFDHGVRLNDRARSHHHVRSDDRERANFYVVGEHRALVDRSCGVNLHSAPASLKLK